MLRKPQDNRIVAFDALRIIAAFAVIVTHIAAQRFYLDSYPSVEWTVRNFYHSLCRWDVPVFVMISGALFLDVSREVKIKKLYTKNIFRIITVFLFWSIVYVLYDGLGNKGFISVLERIIQGHFHLWFLKMLIGLYVAVPILRVIVSNKKIEQYFIGIALLTAYLYPMCIQIMGYLNDTGKYLLAMSYSGLDFHIASGYVGYFLLGHYVHTYEMKKSYIRGIYALGVLSIFTVFILTQCASDTIGGPYTGFYEYLNVFTMFETVSIFLFVKNIHFAPKYCSILRNISNASLGIYLIHALVMQMECDYFGIGNSPLMPALLIPCDALLTFVVSYVIIEILIRIPVVNKIIM